MARAADKVLRARQEYAARVTMVPTGPPVRPIVLNPRCTVCGKFRGSKIHRAHARGSVKRP